MGIAGTSVKRIEPNTDKLICGRCKKSHSLLLQHVTCSTTSERYVNYLMLSVIVGAIKRPIEIIA